MIRSSVTLRKVGVHYFFLDEGGDPGLGPPVFGIAPAFGIAPVFGIAPFGMAAPGFAPGGMGIVSML